MTIVWIILGFIFFFAILMAFTPDYSNHRQYRIVPVKGYENGWYIERKYLTDPWWENFTYFPIHSEKYKIYTEKEAIEIIKLIRQKEKEWESDKIEREQWRRDNPPKVIK